MSRSRGSIRPRGRDTWEIRITLGYDAKGNAIRQTYTVKGSAKEAEKEKTRLLREIDTGRYVKPVRLTLGQYLEEWLPGHAVTEGWGAKHRQEVAGKVRAQIVPRLGDVPLEKLTTARLQKFVQECLVTGRVAPDRISARVRAEGLQRLEEGLSPATVGKLLTILSMALKAAVQCGLLAHNPCAAVRRPKEERFRGKALSPEQANELLAAAEREGGIWLVVVALGLGTGIRCGEMAGLRWEDIDLEAGRLLVRHSLSETKAEGLKLKETKNQTEGSLSLPAEVVGILRRHRGRQAQGRLLAGSAYRDRGFVLAEEDGGPVKPSKISNGFDHFLRRHGFEHLRLHDLRHSHGSLLFKAVGNLKAVQVRLRHKNYQTTADVYLHLLGDADREAVTALEKLLEWRTGTEGGLR